MDTAIQFLATLWSVTAQMSPWLLIGFAVAGVLWVIIRPEWVERHLGGPGMLPVVKATLLGVPLPLCSCGVIPVTAGIVRQGAGRGPAAAFLISTPQTGVDSIFATYALLGPLFAVVRPGVALLSGIVGGAVIAAAGSPLAARPKESACNDGCHEHATAKGPWLKRALKYGLVTLPGDIAWSLLVGLLVAAGITAFIDAGQLEPWLGGGLGAMLIMIAVGIPLYVCSTGSIPLALGFVHLGASPGAALAFLIAGPATNAATVSVMWKLLGPRSTVLYLLTVVGSALAAGTIIDGLGVAVPRHLLHAHHHDAKAGLTLIDHALAWALLLVLAAGLAGRYAKGMAKSPSGTQQITLKVAGMNCSHCVGAVQRALTAIPGVTGANVELAGGIATVSGDSLDPQRLIDAVRSVGYEAQR